MDDNIQKAMWLGVGVLMFVAIVSTALFLLNKGQNLADQSGEQLDAVANELSQVQYDQYDNVVLSGGDVLNAIKSAANQNKTGSFIIYVKTNYEDTYYISDGSISDGKVTGDLSELDKSEINGSIIEAKDNTSDTYINPTADFMSQLVYDDNNVVRGIQMEQE